MEDAGGLHVAPSQRPAASTLIAALKSPQPPFVLLVSGAHPTASHMYAVPAYQGFGFVCVYAYNVSQRQTVSML